MIDILPMIVRDDCFQWLEKHKNLEGKVHLIITDPPYGNIVEEEWDRDWTANDYLDVTRLSARFLIPGGTAYIWGGIGKRRQRYFFEFLSRVEDEVDNIRIWDVITWSKKRAYGKKNAYLFTREECVMLVKGDSPATFNIPLLDEKRGYAGYNPKYPAKSEFKRRTNVWTDITELFRGKIHPCQKPHELAKVMIETSSNPGDLVLDMFAGSGSTGVAARLINRKSILIEKSNCPMHGYCTSPSAVNATE